MQLLPWPSYSSDVSSIEHAWDLVGRHLARDSRPAASKDELLLRIQAMWNSLPQADIQNETPNTDFGHLFFFFFASKISLFFLYKYISFVC